jgi:histidyl-tRNA synthetase
MPAKKKKEEPKKKPVQKKTATKAQKPLTEKQLAEEAKQKKKRHDLLRGFRDILPEEQGRWNFIRQTIKSLADAYSFDRIDLPILEKADLFNRTIGKATDIIDKEMYIFTDPSNRSVALRPEATASAARAYISHGMLDRPQPVKLWYTGPMFRHDRPQAGRYRQFYQTGFESFGVNEPIVDAQLVIIAMQIFKELGLDVKVKINSIGTVECRKAYLVELVAYFRQHRSKLSDEDKKRLQKNPLRLLDSKDETTKELLEGAPQILDWLDDKSKDHFMKVLEFLEEFEIAYTLDPYLVRGLDYYTHTVFEFVPAEVEGTKAQAALGGGGRYNGLIQLLGGREETPGCGFALGMERIARALDAKGINPPARPAPQVFFAQLGDDARRIGLRLFEDFRKAGIPTAEAFGKNALKAQLETANKLGVQLTLILGQKEVLDGTIIIRDMDSGAQEIVDVKKVVQIVKKKLSQDQGVKPVTQSPVVEK